MLLHWKATSSAYVVTDAYVTKTATHADRLLMSGHHSTTQKTVYMVVSLLVTGHYEQFGHHLVSCSYCVSGDNKQV